MNNFIIIYLNILLGINLIISEMLNNLINYVHTIDNKSI